MLNLPYNNTQTSSVKKQFSKKYWVLVTININAKGR